MSGFGPDNDSKTLTNARAFAQAAERSCEVVIADDRTLQLDIDNDDDYSFFMSAFPRLQKYVGVVDPYPENDWANPWTEWKSRSGNRHITITLAKPLDVTTRIMLQACLGSDRVREILNYARFLSGEPKAVLLFKPLWKQIATVEPKQLVAGDGELLDDEDIAF